MTDVLLDVWIARALVAAVNDDKEAVLRERQRILDRIETRAEYRYWGDVAGWWAGRPASERAPEVQWLENAEAARIRWLRTADARKQPAAR
jgi:hypothetical protein